MKTSLVQELHKACPLHFTLAFDPQRFLVSEKSHVHLNEGRRLQEEQVPAVNVFLSVYTVVLQTRWDHLSDHSYEKKTVLSITTLSLLVFILK